MTRPIDIEAALVTSIDGTVDGSITLTACAPPLSEGFEAHLPMVYITRTGGNNSDMVIDNHSVSFDIYAPTWEAATVAANATVALVRSMEGGTIGDVPCYSASPSLPYANPDPRHPDIPRVTFNAQVSTRTKEA